MTRAERRALIAIPMGDPAGIGPEITVKALNDKHIYDRCCPLVVGDPDVLRQAMTLNDQPNWLWMEKWMPWLRHRSIRNPCRRRMSRISVIRRYWRH